MDGIAGPARWFYSLYETPQLVYALLCGIDMLVMTRLGRCCVSRL